MFSNVFLNPRFDGPAPEYPRHLYMRLDQVDGPWLLFDAISRQFFDGLTSVEGVSGWMQHSHKAPVFVLEMSEPQSSAQLPWQALEEHDKSTWFDAELNWSGGKSVLYFNLFREGLKVDVSNISVVPAERADQLSQAFALTGLATAPGDIQNTLNGVSQSIELIGVYDVGQGSANGLCDSVEAPLAYFDLGGGVNANKGTFPSALSDFCYFHAPPVILSHWDWDHWSSGARFQGAQNLTWIVPQQTLGAVHATFAAGLHSVGKLQVWPPGLPQLTSGQMTVYKCTGRGAGRNHTGLAMEVAGPANKPPILLTGDARYSAIPNALGKPYTSVVAPHHGADMGSPATPPGTNLAGARTAYSFGTGNSFGHPKATTQRDHHAAGWPHAAHHAPIPVDRETASRGQHGLGHLGLGWTSNLILPGHNCNSAFCAVALRQT